MSDYVMTAKHFIKQALKAADLPSCYVTGCFGAPLNYPGAIERWEAEWPSNKKHDALIRQRAADAKAAGTECYGWDCINYCKALLWQWDAKPDQEYGGSIYQYQGIPDVTVYDMFNKYCIDRTTDFSNIIPGAFLYYGDGSHCGIYIGDGYAAEATAKWDRKISISAVENLSDRYPEIKTYEKKRTWQAWGKLPWIDYQDAQKDTMTIKSTIICPCCGKSLEAAISLTLKQDELLTVYTVQDGDTPWGIARKFYGDGSKYYIIMDYNDLPRDAYIMTGQQLKIPRI